MLMLFTVLSVLTAEPVENRVQARLATPDVLAARFEQQKQIKGFKKPVRSSGHFVVAKGKGVRWSTEKPFTSELLVTRDAITASHADAGFFSLDATKEPGVRTINGVLFALLSGDVSALREQFELTGSATAATWSLELVPKRAPLKSMFNSIALEGDTFIRAITINEVNADVTRITVLEPHAAATDAW